MGAPGVKESQIERRMTERIRDRGGLCLKWASPGSGGVPDRIVFLPGGRVVFVELKAAGGRLSDLQRWQHWRLQGMGAEVRTLYGLDEAMAFVDEVLPEGGKGL